MRHGLPYFPGLVPAVSEYIPRSHAVISPGVQLGTLTGFDRKGLIQDAELVGNVR